MTDKKTIQDESKRRFIRNILAGGAAVATSGLTNKVFGEVYDDEPTKEEKMKKVVDCLKNLQNYDLRIKKYASKQLPIGFIAKLDVDFVDPRANGASCDISFGVNTNEFSPDYFPHAILSGGEVYLSGKVCAQFQDAFVKLRDSYVGGYIADIRKAIAGNAFGLDTRERDPVFIPGTKGYVSIDEKKKIVLTYVRFVYTLLDSNGDGTPDELTIRQESLHNNDSKVVLYTLRDPNFLGTKDNPGLYDGLFKEVYDRVQRDRIMDKVVPTDQKLEKELEKTLKRSLEDTMRKMF